MNKSATISINFSIVLFLTSLSLCGMEPKYSLLRNEQLIQHPHDLARINRNFAEGILHYQKGNKAVAEVILFGTYADADKKNLISCVDETLLTRVRSMICVTQCQHGFYETALSFADDLEDQQKIYHRMAQKAYKDGNFALGQKYVQHTLTTKKEIAEYQKQCTHDAKEMTLQAGEIIDYEQKYIDEKAALREDHQAKIKYEYSMSSTLGVDPHHPDFACLLSVMSLNDNQENPSYAQSLEYAKKAVKSLTRTSFDTGMSFRYTAHFPTTLERLCTKPTDLMIKNTALVLQKYYDVISALKTKNHARIRELSALYKTENTVEAIPLQLLCSGMDTDHLHTLIQNFTIDNPEFVTFYTSSEGKIAIPILKWALLHLELSQKEKDLYHIFLGGYEYHSKKIEDSVAHIKQCSDYDKDIYLRALRLKMANPEVYYEEMSLLLPLLQKSLSQPEKNVKIVQAHKIIATQCDYNPSLPIQKIVSACEKITLNALSSSKATDPFEHGYMLLARADAHKKNELLSAEQEKIKTLTSYFLFFDALNSNDQKKLDQFFSAKAVNNDIRFIVLKNFRSKNQNGIKDIIFEDTSFEEFILSDTFFIEKLLKDILNRPTTLCKIAPEDIHYILGGIASVKGNYGVALEHFLHCNKKDEYTLAKIIEATNIKDMLTPLQEYVSLIKINASKASNNPSKRKVAADELIKKVMNGELIGRYVRNALRQGNYENTYEFIDSVLQLKIPETYSSLCAWFLAVETKIAQFSAPEYHRFRTTPHRSSIYTTIQEHAHKKDHHSCFCHYLALALLKNGEHKSHTQERILDLHRKALRYLSCFLNHEITVDKQTYEERVTMCGDLASCFGSIDCSRELLDLAIKCGNPTALRSKAVLLSKKNNTNKYDTIIVELLKKHVISNDMPADRARSYNDLGSLFYETQDTQDLHNKKLIFDYLKAAADSFEKIIAEPNENDQESMITCWMIGLTQLHLLDEDTNLSQDVLHYLNTAYSLLSQEQLSNINNTSAANRLPLYKHKATMDLVEKKINHILDHNKIDDLSLGFCAIIGPILFQQCSERPTTDPYRKCAISALVHAAKNDCANAALWLANVTNEEVKLEDRIYYIEMLSPVPSLQKSIDDILKDMYPEGVIGQARLICYFAKKGNEALLKKYLMQLYENHMPIVHDPILYKIYPETETKINIQECLQIPLLRESADAFLKNPKKAGRLQHFSAIFLGSLLTYSLLDNQLLGAADYLETSRTNFSQIQIKDIEDNLGHIYYKLGWIEQKKGNEASKIKYFEKGKRLNNERCRAMLSPTPAQNIIMANMKEKPTTLEKKSELPSKPPAYERLIDKETKIFTEKDFDQTLSVDALSKCNEPKKCLLSVIEAYARKKSNNVDLIMQYIQKAIAHGTIESASMKIIKFKDNIILSHICEVITKIIEQNQAKHLALLPKIKKELIKHGMNIKDFEDYYHFFSKINIAKFNIWKKAK